MLGKTYDSQVCSIARSLEQVGERWSLLIIRDALFAQVTRFGDFQHNLGIATNERESIELRKQALFWAGNNRAATVTEIAGLYDRVADREMKEQIIFVLSQNRAEAAVDKLMDIARRDSDRDLRSKAVFWLGQSRDPRVLKFLEELINR